MLNTSEIMSTIDMIREQKLDIRTITMGISLLSCAGERTAQRVYDLITRRAERLVQVGEAIVEISQIGKICHTRCAIYYLAGDCIFPREGIFGWVVEPGEVRVGDEVRILELGTGEVHRELSDKPRKA